MGHSEAAVEATCQPLWCARSLRAWCKTEPLSSVDTWLSTGLGLMTVRWLLGGRERRTVESLLGAHDLCYERAYLKQ